MRIQAPSPICVACATTLGIHGGFQGAVLILPDDATQQDIDAATAFINNMPVEHNHPPVPDRNQVAATDRWVNARQRLAALPALADPDPYAVARARLQADVDAAWGQVQGLGGPV